MIAGDTTRERVSNCDGQTQTIMCKEGDVKMADTAETPIHDAHLNSLVSVNGNLLVRVDDHAEEARVRLVEARSVWLN